jgi:hypothetical protein
VDELELILADMLANGWADMRTGEAADELTRRLHDEATRGAVWAEARLLQWEHEGARRAWNRAVRAERRTWVTPEGRRLDIPTTYNTPEREDDGTATGTFRPRKLLLMEWVVLEETRDRRAAEARVLDSRVRYMDHLLDYRAQCPQSINALDAMQRLGIDPESEVDPDAEEAI